MNENSYVLIEISPSLVQRHGGPRQLRRFGLYINSKLFNTYTEDSPPSYNSGMYFDREINDEIKHLRKFFPGSMESVKRPRLQRFPNRIRFK